jgi:hypothetical protein
MERLVPGLYVLRAVNGPKFGRYAIVMAHEGAAAAAPAGVRFRGILARARQPPLEPVGINSRLRGSLRP